MVLVQNVPAAAADFSPVGLWKTMDDKTGEAKFFINGWTDKGGLFGRIEKLLPIIWSR